MDSIIDFTQSRKARTERGDQFRIAAKDLLMLLERQRTHISEEFMTFLIAMAISDQAMFYAAQAKNKKAGLGFIDHLFVTVKQIFESQYQEERPPLRSVSRASEPSSQVLEFSRAADSTPE